MVGNANSGRRPDLFKVIEAQKKNVIDMQGAKFEIPNYSGIKDAAKKTSSSGLMTNPATSNLDMASYDIIAGNVTTPLANIDIRDSSLATGTGTFSCNGTTGVVTGTGTSFTTEVNIGSLVYFVTANRWVQVQEITSNTSMVVYPAVSTSGTWKYVRHAFLGRNQPLTIWGSSITDGDDEPVHITLDPNAPLGDNTYGFLSISGSSNAGNLRYISLIDRGTSGGTGSPYIYIENQNGSGSRVGAFIAGLRSSGQAFLQTETSFRMEAFGGGLGQIQTNWINFDEGQEARISGDGGGGFTLYVSDGSSVGASLSSSGLFDASSGFAVNGTSGLSGETVVTSGGTRNITGGIIHI